MLYDVMHTLLWKIFTIAGVDTMISYISQILWLVYSNKANPASKTPIVKSIQEQLYGTKRQPRTHSATQNDFRLFLTKGNRPELVPLARLQKGRHF